MPLVLFTAPECRAIVLDLEIGEAMGEHEVRERAVVQVITGRVSLESSGDAYTCDAGALAIFEPGERHTAHALTAARLLLILAPWPGTEHYTDAETEYAQRLPANALVDPMPPTDADADSPSSG
jgi:quercetin dioxygenase-like cupin family protein